MSNGFWFACIYPQNLNHMVPGIGGNTSTDPALNSEFANMAPVVEYNKYDSQQAPVTSKSFNRAEREKVERPPFLPLANALKEQGLIADDVRGTSNTSARRESPSRVHGLLTPRGHSFQIDDGFQPEVGGEPENEFIRFRTRNGVQVLINDTEGFIYLVTRKGNSWVEISDDGIDMYSKESISMNSEKDVNINAGGKVGINGDSAVHVTGGFYSSFTTGDTAIVSGGKVGIQAVDNIGIKSSHDVSLDAVRDVTSNAGRNILNGACGIISNNATFILDNSGGAPPPEVDHVPFQRDAILRKPSHEPFDRTGQGAGRQATGVDSNGNAIAEIRNSDGEITSVPVVAGDRAALMKTIYDGLRRRGWTVNASRQMVAQIGRENDFQTRYIFGYHRDPHPPHRVNIGLISWQGDRGAKIDSHLQSRGVIRNGRMDQTTAAIEAQLDFMDHEISTKSEYRQTKAIVRNESASLAQVEGVLSRNYIRWRRDDAKYRASGLNRMSGYLAQITRLSSNSTGKA
jgi:uncharacterized protein (DUF2345 family)